jgi:long-chain acyl-CoA synthetase
VGEIVARGANVMQGYWNAPAETAAVLRADGLHTGDLARQDADGFLYVVDRLKNMIKVGAHRVAAREIEDAIAEVDGVVESCVVGVPDGLLGEAVEAFVVVRNGSVDHRAILVHLQRCLARYKIPRGVRFLARLPKTAAGKIDRRRVRALAEAGSAEAPL